MCVDFHAYLSGATHMRQEFTVCQIKSHFSIVCRFYLFSHVIFFFYSVKGKTWSITTTTYYKKLGIIIHYLDKYGQLQLHAAVLGFNHLL
jgi:hypothetical protein